LVLPGSGLPDVAVILCVGLFGLSLLAARNGIIFSMHGEALPGRLREVSLDTAETSKLVSTGLFIGGVAVILVFFT
jgi:hypothetical protein